MYKRMNEQLQKEGAMALVTGASSGIGLAYARELARRGYDLLLVSNEQEQIGTVAEELAAAFGVKTIPVCMDLARSEAARELYEYCEREKLQIGILVNGLPITGIWPAAANDRQQVQLAHHTQDRLDIHQLPGPALNPASNAANAVGLLALPLARHDQVNQPLILCFFLLPVSPGIISAAAYFKHFAHGFYAVSSAESLNHPIFQFHLLPASNRKFRSNSTCIRSFANSLCCFSSSLTASLWGRPLGRVMYPPASIRSFLRCRSIRLFTCRLSRP